MLVVGGALNRLLGVVSPGHAWACCGATWPRELVLIGDAGHAPSPSSGQGASLAIEDAVQLGKCLRDLPDPERAFAAYEQVRRPRVEPIVKQAARINSSNADQGLRRVLRDVTMPLVFKLIANSKQTKQVYQYHIDWGTRAYGV